MEFRCSECGHIGPAESVSQIDGGVQLECAECGATSGLDVGAGSSEAESEETEAAAAEQTDDSTPPEPTSDRGTDGSRGDPDRGESPTGAVAASAPDGTATPERPTFDARSRPGADGAPDSGPELRLSGDEAVDRLVPDDGAGIRCPKCATLLRADAENCVRCGLRLDEARQYDDGEAPWEQPEPGKEGAFERAELLWETFREARDAEKLEEFVEFVEAQGLYEMAIRKLRFYLVEHPEDEAGYEALRKLAMGVQSRVASAQAKAEVEAEELNEELQNFKRKLLYTVLVLWALAVVLFIYIFWG